MVVLLDLPALGSKSRINVALPPGAAVGLQDTHALTGQAVHRQVARSALTLSLPGPAIHHAAGKLITRQELTEVCLISCEEEGKHGRH